MEYVPTFESFLNENKQDQANFERLAIAYCKNPYSHWTNHDMKEAAIIFKKLTNEEKEKCWRFYNANINKSFAVTTVDNFINLMNDVAEWNITK